MKKLKNGVYVFLFLLVVVTLRPVAAQAPDAPSTVKTVPSSPIQSTNMLYENVDPTVSKNLHTLSQNAIIEVLASFTCFLSGRDPLNPVNGKCLGIDAKTGKMAYQTDNAGGVAQTMGGLIGGTFAIPVSGGGYAQYAMENFGITKKAIAAPLDGSEGSGPADEVIRTSNGLGYDRLKPLIGIWTRFRDIAYLGFVLAFTIIGLAIMFRIKIDARTVMSVQNQLPKIIVALIMVTFSYAIAGFLIDMMYVLMFLVILTFNSLTPTNVDTDSNVFTVVNKAFSPGYGVPGIIGLTSTISFGISKAFGSLAVNFLESTISNVFQLMFSPFQAISSIGCGAVNIAATGGLSALGYIPKVGDWLKDLPGIGGLFGGSCDFIETFFQGIVISIFTIISFLVILIAIIVSLFRVWFTLIKSFAYILIDTLIAPLWITAGIFPGSKLGFGTWIKHLMGHLSVFPMTFAVILLGKTIIDNVGGSQPMFSPPLIGGDIGGNTAIAGFIGFGFIISTPSILDRTRKAIGAVDFGLTDLKRGFGAGRTLTGKGMSGVQGMKFGSKSEFISDGHGGSTTEAVKGPTRFIKGFLGR